MKRYSTLMVACGALAFAGCLVGEVEDVQPGPGAGTGGNIPGATPDAAPINTPDPGNNANPEQIFTQQVQAPVTQACSPGGACHSAQAPAFIPADPAVAYTTIKNYRDQLFLGYEPTTARLLLNGNGTHYNATFDQTAIDAIALWLAAEKQAAADNPEEPSPLAVWSGCMNLQDWQNAGVADAWADKGTNQGNCDACHNLGADGFMASNQDARVFNTITTSPSFMPSYFTLDAAGTGVMINRPRFEAVANGTPPHQGHPRFNVDGDAMNRLQQFYQTTLQRQLNNQCEAPRFVQ